MGEGRAITAAEARGRLLRLRGGYALVAGLLLLVAVPLVQGVALNPAGYSTAVDAAASGGNFAPLLAWIAAHPLVSRLYRVLQLVPFLLAIPLPGALCGALWPARQSRPRAAAIALWAGRAGFALFALAIVSGVLTSAASASDYATAKDAAARDVAVRGFAAGYAVQTVLSQVLGGLLLAIFLTLVGRRMGQGFAAPAVFRFFGFLVAALAALNALLFALAPGQVETPFSTPAFFGLALWLVGLGLVLPRLALPAAPPAPEGADTNERTVLPDARP